MHKKKNETWYIEKIGTRDIRKDIGLEPIYQ